MKPKLYILVTIDVEDPLLLKDACKTDAAEKKSMIYGKINSEYFGFPKIIQICNSFDIKATFFLDVFEYNRYGKERFKAICQEIMEKGNDVQLHIHPNRGYDEKRQRMIDYTIEEQIQIIKDGKNLFKELKDEYPIAYRGGSYYSIDNNTLEALRINEIPIDSTMFYGQPNCKVAITKNKIVEYNGIIEVPVTMFQKNRNVVFRNHLLKRQPNFIKTDIDWANLEELKWFVQQAKENDIRVMNLFMHSYSLLKFNESFTKFEPDRGDIEKFDKFLSFVVSDPEIKVITMKEFYQMYRKNSEQFYGSDYIPVINSRETLDFTKYGIRKIKDIIRRLK